MSRSKSAMIHLSRAGWEGGVSRVIAEGGDGGVHWVMASLPKTGAGVQSRPHKASEREITHFPQITLFLFSFKYF